MAKKQHAGLQLFAGDIVASGLEAAVYMRKFLSYYATNDKVAEAFAVYDFQIERHITKKAKVVSYLRLSSEKSFFIFPYCKN